MSDIRMRLAQARADIDKVSDFLLATYRLTHDKHNWELRRWHGWCYYGAADQWEQQCQQVALWETLTGELVAVMHPENQGTAFFETHPDYRYLEVEMLAWAEKHLRAVRDEKAYLEISVEDSDSQRQALLQQAGYHALDYHYFSRWQDLNQTLPEPVLPAGYTIRSLKDEDADIARLINLINAAFGHQHTVTMYRNFMQAPCYRLDLDIGVVAPDGSFAATAGFTFDSNRIAQLEPVCTHPEQRRKGLAKAAILAGLQKVQALCGERAYVGTGGDAATNQFYADCGFLAYQRGTIWQKVFS